jgi:hypothetical protein
MAMTMAGLCPFTLLGGRSPPDYDFMTLDGFITGWQAFGAVMDGFAIIMG